MWNARQCLIAFVTLGWAVLVGATDAGKSDARWQRDDVKAFRDTFLAIDRSFSPSARATAEARLSKIENASEPLSPSAFAVELCRIAALADNAHTRCLPGGHGRGMCRQFATLMGENSPWCNLRAPDFEVPDFASVPIAFYPFGESFNVVRVVAEHADLLGAQLVTVDGRSIQDMRATLHTFAGGTLAHRDDMAAQVLASPEQLHAVGLAETNKSVLYEFVLSGGQRTERRFSVAPAAAGPSSWRQLPPPDRAAWSFKEPEKAFRFRDAPEIDSFVVQLRQTLDADDETITDFLARAEQQRKDLGRRNIVLDMRTNGGGNFLLTRDFMINWPTRVPGRFYVLTSRQTFSAAITSIAYLKQAAADRVVILGEPVGDRLMFFSDGLPIRLPHSGLFFVPAVVRMDYADGCRRYDDCFEAIAQPGRPAAIALLRLPPNVQRLPVAVRTVEPDVLAPWTIASWLDGTDPAMDAVTAMVGKRASR